MYVIKSKTSAPVPLALPSRTVYLHKAGDEAQISDYEFNWYTTQGQLKLGRITATKKAGDLKTEDTPLLRQLVARQVTAEAARRRARN